MHHPVGPQKVHICMLYFKFLFLGTLQTAMGSSRYATDAYHLWCYWTQKQNWNKQGDRFTTFPNPWDCWKASNNGKWGDIGDVQTNLWHLKNKLLQLVFPKIIKGNFIPPAVRKTLSSSQNKLLPWLQLFGPNGWCRHRACVRCSVGSLLHTINSMNGASQAGCCATKLATHQRDV